jgi:hypothetical protein
MILVETPLLPYSMAASQSPSPLPENQRNQAVLPDMRRSTPPMANLP